jgi:hypothetical protein
MKCATAASVSNAGYVARARTHLAVRDLPPHPNRDRGWDGENDQEYGDFVGDGIAGLGDTKPHVDASASEPERDEDECRASDPNLRGWASECSSYQEADCQKGYPCGNDLDGVRRNSVLVAESRLRVAVPPNGPRLSCGRLARRAPCR